VDVGTIATVIASFGTVLAAGATIWLARLTSGQLHEAAQVRLEAVEARYAEQRPVVIPIGYPEYPMIGGTRGYDVTAPRIEIQARNVGPGPALNVRATLFPPAPDAERPQDRTQSRHSAKLDMPLASGAEQSLEFGQGGLDVWG